ncbi:unnamed protein product [Thelazia callipaeda]|uniref:Leuk-A4-hydro_C domain-containing protein n=1 Tax=Thelazia callipaeda TaxID=103827 RepID=A0A0N5D1D3_THECL|nr:unnamed protein product [Thelazia callipaeda]
MGDPSSVANFGEATIDHMSLDWVVDFEKSQIRGSVVLSMRMIQKSGIIVLDGHSLKISRIEVDNEKVTYQIQAVPKLGERIVINVDLREPDETFKLVIFYQTGANCTALQFLEPVQTHAKLKPYLFSQCQTVHARSIVPCMDTPSVKQTYDAMVTVPSDLVCLMSAISVGEPENLGEFKKYSFKQSVPIPSYLLAIVIGLMEKRELSIRSAIWAEPTIIENAFSEFAGTEKLLQTAENLMGKYEWQRYDLVVLPLSFPYSGMENPCLTFLTPSLIAGDQSAVHVIAHEISHSWTGNLVTNANWEHFWLNEGFTTFFERKITEILEGKQQRHFEAQCGWEACLAIMKEQYSCDHPLTKLIPDLRNRHPENAFSLIPYEKGSALLMFLEEKIGAEPFIEFLRAYIQNYARKSVVTEDWKNYLYSYFPQHKNMFDAIDWDNWFYGTGIPKTMPQYDETAMNQVVLLAKKWADLGDNELEEIDGSVYFSMSSLQKTKVTDYLRLKVHAISHEKLVRLDDVCGLSESRNSDILSSWILLGLKNQWRPIVRLALHFIASQGRISYLRPIYRALFHWSKNRRRAIHAFQSNASFMHPITKAIVADLIPKCEPKIHTS